jgi:hypothetical protein
MRREGVQIFGKQGPAPERWRPTRTQSRNETPVARVEKRCVECGSEFEANDFGRPAVYCDPACRRAAEFRIRRINTRLLRLEAELDAIESGRTWPHATAAWRRGQADALKERIAVFEGRLRQLLAAGAPDGREQ